MYSHTPSSPPPSLPLLVREAVNKFKSILLKVRAKKNGDANTTTTSSSSSDITTIPGRLFSPLESIALLRGGFTESCRNTSHTVTLAFVFLSHGKVLEDLIDDCLDNENVASGKLV